MVRQAVSIDNKPDETSHACVARLDDKYDDGDGGGIQVIATVVALP